MAKSLSNFTTDLILSDIHFKLVPIISDDEKKRGMKFALHGSTK